MSYRYSPLVRCAAAVLFVAVSCVTLGVREAEAVDYSIGLNFQGTDLSSQGSLEPTGFGSIPPDTMGAVGPNHVAELINGAFGVYDKGTASRTTHIGLETFWDGALTNSGAGTVSDDPFDPRILYDSYAERWYAVSVDKRQTADSRVLVGVTTGNDPSPNNWHGFTIDADSSGERWADFPTVGLNGDGLFISNNMFDNPTGPPISTTVTTMAIPKSSLTAATPSIAGHVVEENIDPNTTGFAMQPALDMDNTSLPLPALAEFDKSSGTLKRSTFPADYFTSATLDTSGGSISVTSRSDPPDAHQPGPDDDVETNDARFSGNVVLNDGSLWGVHAVESSGRAALEWYEIDEASNSVVQSGLLADDSLDLYFPSIAVNDLGHVVIGTSGSDDDTPISTYAFVGETVGGTTTFDPIIQTFEGTGSYSITDGSDRNRWGDYSATVLDPEDPYTFWTFQEYVDGTDNWSVRITELNIVPEPASWMLLVAACVCGLIGRRRRSRYRSLT